MVDLVKNTSTCDELEAVEVELVSSEDRRSVTCSYGQSKTSVTLASNKRAIFNVTYGQAPTGWTVNIGDSPTNNGASGDAATQSRDAEMQIRDQSMAVFGNDHTVGSKTLTQLNSLGLTGGSQVSLTVDNERLDWSGFPSYSSPGTEHHRIYMLSRGRAIPRDQPIIASMHRSTG